MALVNPGSVLAALLAGLAVALFINSPPAAVSRALSRGSDVDGSPKAVLLPRWVRPRPDAASPGQRALVASMGGIAVGLALRALGGEFEQLGWVVIPIMAVVGTVVLGRLEPGASRRRQQRLIGDLPQALELLSACLAAGMPPRQATSAVASSFDGPVAEDLGQVMSLVNLGVSDAEAWRVLRSHPQWGAAAIDLARSVESGTMMVEALVHHARQARNDRRAALEVRAKAVGVRSVLPLMTCFLPAFMLIGVVPTVASAVMTALS